MMRVAKRIGLGLSTERVTAALALSVARRRREIRAMGYGVDRRT